MDNSHIKEDLFFLEDASIEPDSDDDFKYEEVTTDYVSDNEVDEDFETAFRTSNKKETTSSEELHNEDNVDPKAEVVEDFIQNFLARMDMKRTFDCFQTEWEEIKKKGLLKQNDLNGVADCYIRNQQLHDEISSLKKDLKRFQDAAQRAKDTHLKLRRERDHHRMHHKRVIQEKDQLITDIKRLRQHYQLYEPTLKALRYKYEAAMKEKMLTKLERDRAVAQIEGLQSVQLVSFECAKGKSSENILSSEKSSDGEKAGISQKNAKDSEFPPDKGVNPFLSKQRIPCVHLTRSGGYRLTNTIEAHSLAVSGFALHPKKQILATVSDDRTWKLWSLPEGDVVMTGEGHTDWLSDCDFNPLGTKLVTTSGDTTVKIWDFAEERCVVSFDGHTHPVWGCSWHSGGDFVATCAMDGTSKIWDLNSLRCRSSLRGHTDSVNSIEFLPFSNTLCTCSADKTIAIWDARTGLSAQTLHGHVHSINHVTFNTQGDSLASCDAYGVVKLWDIRNSSVSTTIDMGPHPVNRVAFDPGSSVVAAASNDGVAKIYEISTGHITPLSPHDDAVQTVLFDRNGEYMVSGSSDSTVKVWS
ncbi:sperm-associated antigen 16 protein-like [Hydractinia symbiolongicarpus]|uniref:sperm-associated antigen 16 protein-like n=1 Tax=Hydractinia symbiolongicarpus TaxID=13093 RepID=UPI00254E52A5|nr:sperm-associated antigen 16 protein-like [Hydractinia symbiolongicarpus]